MDKINLEDKDLEQVTGGRAPEVIDGSKNTYQGIFVRNDAPYELVLDK